MSGPNDAEMRKRETAPAMTIAMGMKMNHPSSECWKAAIFKEKRIREDWMRSYMPHVASREEEIAKGYWRKQEEKRFAPQPPERRLLLEGVSKEGGGRAAYLKARRAMSPQEKFRSGPMTMSQEVGWKCNQLPPPRPDDLPKYGHKPIIEHSFFRRTIGGSLAQTTR